MSKITLNFFGETTTVNKPKTLSSLRKEISESFCLSSQDAAEIILTYKKHGEKQIISNDEELKTFLNSKSSRIDLEISQNSKLYKDNFNKLQEENLKGKKSLDELLQKRKELNDLKTTKFLSERKEIKEIDKQIIALLQRKNKIGKKIFEGMRQLEKDIKENDKKIQELQKKFFSAGETEKIEAQQKPQTQQQPQVQPKIIPHYMRFAPPILHHPMPNKNPKVHPFFFHRKNIIKPNINQIKTNPHPCPHVHPCFFPRKYHIQAGKKKLGVKFAETEYIDIPKETNKTITITETNEAKETKESNDDLNLKMRTIDDWEECLLLKTQEITNKLTDKFKGLETLKIFSGLFDEEKKEEVKPEIKKNELQLKNSTSSHGNRPEGVPKKLEHCPTAGNILEKEKIANKIVHFGVKCDQCGKFPIVGCRYKCSVCPNFDFCEDCEEKYSHLHNHAFFKINNPSMRNLIYKNFVKK